VKKRDSFADADKREPLPGERRTCAERNGRFGAGAPNKAVSASACPRYGFWEGRFGGQDGWYRGYRNIWLSSRKLSFRDFCLEKRERVR